MHFFHFHWPYILCAGLGISIAFTELLSRYKSNLWGMVKSFSAWVYVGINGSSSVLCLYLLKAYGYVVINLSNEGQTIGLALAAGLGSMAILRSSVITIKDSMGNQNQVGIVRIIEVLLHRAERQFDQERASSDIKMVNKIMKDVDVRKYDRDLTTTCLNVMQGLSEEEQKKLAADISKLINEVGISEETLRTNVGLVLLRITGPKLLKDAISTLKPYRSDSSPMAFMNSAMDQAQNKIVELLSSMKGE